MKTKILMLLFIMVSLSMQSQDSLKTNVIKINLSSPNQKSVISSENGKRLTVRSRDFLQLELVGGNPFKYNYVIERKLVNFFEDKTNNPLNNIEKNINKALPKESISTEDAYLKIEAKKAEIEDKLKDLNKPKKNSRGKIIPKTDKEQKIIDSLNLEKKEAVYKAVAINSNNIIKNSKGNKNDTITAININDDKSKLTEALHLLKVSLDEFELEFTNFEMESKSNDELKIDSFIKSRDYYFKKFELIVKDYYKVRQDASKFKTLDANYDLINEGVKNVLASITNDFKEMFSLKTKNYFLPIDINGKNIDVVELSVKKYEKNNPVALEEHVYNVWINGGFKIDISGGLFISSLINKEFVADNDPVNPGKKIINERQKGDYEFGFGSMINISHRSAGWVNPTLNVGAMFTNTQQFQLLTGVGLILGKEERIIFGSGISMGRVTRLQGNLKVGDNNQDFGSSGTIPTSNVFAFGYYFGVTYNFSSKTKEAK